MTKSSSDSWYVYMLRCRDGSLYTGIAKDLQRRFRQHNEGKASRYTRSRRPTVLVYRECQPNRGLALRREAAIKALSRQEKVDLIGLAG